MQFLQGKAFQNEFGHALNALLDSERQVVVAADRPPADLEALDERVRSRLAGGLCVEMMPLDEPLRVKILEARITAARAQNPNFSVSPAVVAYVARSIVSNGRDLEGAVNRLIAHSNVGSPLTVEAAEAAIRDLIRAREPRAGQDRGHPEAGRQPLQRQPLRHSLGAPHGDGGETAAGGDVSLQGAHLAFAAEIGRRFGGRDHTTVLHACARSKASAPPTPPCAKSSSC